MLVPWVTPKIASRPSGYRAGPPRSCKRSSERPVPPPKGGSPRRDTAARTRGGGADGLACRACGLPITSWALARAVDGHGVHQRTNPAGIAFEFGCFASAPGATTVGESTAEHTWFPGCTWCLALCLGCGTHLGWRFAGLGDSFFGLILQRLVESREGRGAP